MATQLQLVLGGRTYRMDPASLSELTIKEAREIKHHTGFRIAGWAQAMTSLTEVDPDVFLGVVYLMRTRAGEEFNWSELDDMPILELMGNMSSVEVPDPDQPPVVAVA